MQSSKTVVITGASSGIGLALANSRHITQSHTLTPSPDLVLVDGDIPSPEVVNAVLHVDGGAHAGNW